MEATHPQKSHKKARSLSKTFTSHGVAYRASPPVGGSITKLKIEKNPFAKGFRDPSGRSPEYEP
ncbi:hypothetical protein ANCDUO_22568 [Ancylostoma duodenale]|uniref:T-box domain-containing protein n=1 Tax=Ancylostoma duodenale TaxID=51022 RepID=A0A0C2BTZ6_9BILA|nr:hypothetical protein ANCDUO_22568 [Ancylostoma duodenale]